MLAAYDVDRQLERGYSLTLDHHGRVLRSPAALTPGDTLTTRFSGGSATSTLVSVSLPGDGGGPATTIEEES